MTKFTLHTEIATHWSKFFHAAVTRPWRESQDKWVFLPDVDADTFAGYFQWLNTGYVTVIDKNSMSELVKLYFLGDYLDDRASRSDVLDRFAKLVYRQERHPNADEIGLIWSQTPVCSPFRQFILDICTACSDKSTTEQITSPWIQYPDGFIADCLMNLAISELRTRDICGAERRQVIEGVRKRIAEP